MALDDYGPIQVGNLPFFQIRDALERQDDEAVWQLGQCAGEGSGFLDMVRTQVFNYSEDFKRGSTVVATFRHSLVLWPVVIQRAESGGSSGPRAEAVKAAFKSAYQELVRCWGDKYLLALYPQLVSYSHLAALGPSQFRQMLIRLVERIDKPVTGSRKLPMGLPSDAPQLFFLVGALSRPITWPEDPAWNNEHALRARELFESAIRFEHATDAPSMKALVQVGRPRLAEASLGEGLGMWLRAIAAQYGLEEWDVLPKDRDLSELVVQLAEAEEHFIRVPIRQYQLGQPRLMSLLTQIAGATEQRLSRTNEVH